MKSEIKEIVKQDLREHPEKRDNLQFCVACAAYGEDLDEVDAELAQERILKKNKIENTVNLQAVFIDSLKNWNKLTPEEQSAYSIINFIDDQDED